MSAFKEAPASLAPTLNNRVRQDGIVLALLMAVVFLLGVIKAAAIPLWSDELATLHLAQAPGWRQMLSLSHQVDLNPPLEPTLVRLSTEIFGPHELGARLPSVFAFGVAVGATFLFLRRRVALPYALFGALLPLANHEVSYYLTEARPYAVLFASVAVATLAYDSIVHGERLFAARLVLAAGLLCTLQAHLFGFPAAAAFVLAEAVRSVRQRRIDLATWGVILLPFLSCVSYIPILRAQSGPETFPMIYEEKDRTSLAKGFLFFHSFLYLPMGPLFKLIAIVLLCTPFFPARSAGNRLSFLPETWALLLALLAVPVLVAIAFHVRAPDSGFFPRYSIAAVVPAFLLLAGFIAWRAGDNVRAGWILALGSAAFAAMSFSNEPRFLLADLRDGFFAAPRIAQNTEGLDKLCPELPLVVNDALDFFQYDYPLGNRMSDRMVYISDPAQALRLEHETATESVAGMARGFHIPHRVVPGAEFLPRHTQFLVLTHDRHRDWFFDEMQAEGAQTVDLGPSHFGGSNSTLWFVSRTQAAPLPGCLASVVTRPR